MRAFCRSDEFLTIFCCERAGRCLGQKVWLIFEGENFQIVLRMFRFVSVKVQDTFCCIAMMKVR